jgi:SAM-dependent methyltransferase
MTGIRPRPAKSYAELNREWDRLAKERHRQIASGEDLSFEHVIVPTIWRLFEGTDRAVVLDIGSGTGDFTLQLAGVARKVIAIEPSRISMALARGVCRTARNVRFVEAPLEEASSSVDKGSATAAVAVMTLMTVPDVRGFAKFCSRLEHALSLRSLILGSGPDIGDTNRNLGFDTRWRHSWKLHL